MVTNGSFESGLTGWSFAAADTNIGSGPCSYNAAVGTSGTETLTGTIGFPATDGANIALGALKQASGSRYACVLYQDITLPAGTLTATLSYDVGIKLLTTPAPAQSSSNTGVQIGLYSTSKVPNDTFDVSSPGVPLVAGTSGYYQTSSGPSGDTVLHHQSFSLDSTQLQPVAGSTVRLAILLVVNSGNNYAVVGLDNVQLTVSVATPPAAPIPSSLLLLGAGMAGLLGWTLWQKRRYRIA